jgi:hypothetical protein
MNNLIDNLENILNSFLVTEIEEKNAEVIFHQLKQTDAQEDEDRISRIF